MTLVSYIIYSLLGVSLGGTFLPFGALADKSQDGQSRRRVCYYTNWSQYRPGMAKFTPTDIDPFLCTHLIFAFAKVGSRGILEPYEWNDIQHPSLYKQFTGLKKKNPALKTLLAVGGWTHGSQPFTNMVATPAKRKQFVKHAVIYLRQHNFDGLDLDWEYPADRGSPPQDKQRFVELVKELRSAFEREAKRTRKERLLLAAAVPGGPRIVKNGYDVATLNRYLDFFNLMSYDLHGTWSSLIGHHAALFGGDVWYDANADSYTVSKAVQLWLDLGASPDKVNMGVATYGKVFPFCSKRHNPGDKKCGTASPLSVNYYDILRDLRTGKLKRKWMKNEMVPYAYSERSKKWIGYDDETSITAKVEFAKSKGLGGVMTWAIDSDDFNGMGGGQGVRYPLLNTIKDTLDAGVKPMKDVKGINDSKEKNDWKKKQEDNDVLKKKWMKYKKDKESDISRLNNKYVMKKALSDKISRFYPLKPSAVPLRTSLLDIMRQRRQRLLEGNPIYAKPAASRNPIDRKTISREQQLVNIPRFAQASYNKVNAVPGNLPRAQSRPPSQTLRGVNAAGAEVKVKAKITPFMSSNLRNYAGSNPVYPGPVNRSLRQHSLNNYARRRTGTTHNAKRVDNGPGVEANRSNRKRYQTISNESRETIETATGDDRSQNKFPVTKRKIQTLKGRKRKGAVRRHRTVSGINPYNNNSPFVKNKKAKSSYNAEPPTSPYRTAFQELEPNAFKVQARTEASRSISSQNDDLLKPESYKSKRVFGNTNILHSSQVQDLKQKAVKSQAEGLKYDDRPWFEHRLSEKKSVSESHQKEKNTDDERKNGGDKRTNSQQGDRTNKGITTSRQAKAQSTKANIFQTSKPNAKQNIGVRTVHAVTFQGSILGDVIKSTKKKDKPKNSIGNKQYSTRNPDAQPNPVAIKRFDHSTGNEADGKNVKMPSNKSGPWSSRQSNPDKELPGQSRRTVTPSERRASPFKPIGRIRYHRFHGTDGHLQTEAERVTQRSEYVNENGKPRLKKNKDKIRKYDERVHETPTLNTEGTAPRADSVYTTNIRNNYSRRQTEQNAAKEMQAEATASNSNEMRKTKINTITDDDVEIGNENIEGSNTPHDKSKSKLRENPILLRDNKGKGKTESSQYENKENKHIKDQDSVGNPTIELSKENRIEIAAGDKTIRINAYKSKTPRRRLRPYHSRKSVSKKKSIFLSPKKLRTSLNKNKKNGTIINSELVKSRDSSTKKPINSLPVHQKSGTQVPKAKMSTSSVNRKTMKLGKEWYPYDGNEYERKHALRVKNNDLEKKLNLGEKTTKKEDRDSLHPSTFHVSDRKNVISTKALPTRSSPRPRTEHSNPKKNERTRQGSKANSSQEALEDWPRIKEALRNSSFVSKVKATLASIVEQENSIKNKSRGRKLKPRRRKAWYHQNPKDQKPNDTTVTEGKKKSKKDLEDDSQSDHDYQILPFNVGQPKSPSLVQGSNIITGGSKNLPKGVTKNASDNKTTRRPALVITKQSKKAGESKSISQHQMKPQTENNVKTTKESNKKTLPRKKSLDSQITYESHPSKPKVQSYANELSKKMTSVQNLKTPSKINPKRKRGQRRRGYLHEQIVPGKEEEGASGEQWYDRTEWYVKGEASEKAEKKNSFIQSGIKGKTDMQLENSVGEWNEYKHLLDDDIKSLAASQKQEPTKVNDSKDDEVTFLDTTLDNDFSWWNDVHNKETISNAEDGNPLPSVFAVKHSPSVDYEVMVNNLEDGSSLIKDDISGSSFLCPTTFGIFEDPNDCRKFYQCVWFISFHHACGLGTAWNPHENICDWPVNTYCHENAF